jgi:hypothetical protein
VCACPALPARSSSGSSAFDYPTEEDLYSAITRRLWNSMDVLDHKLCAIETKEGDTPAPAIECEHAKP